MSMKDVCRMSLNDESEGTDANEQVAVRGITGLWFSALTACDDVPWA